MKERKLKALILEIKDLPIGTLKAEKTDFIRYQIPMF